MLFTKTFNIQNIFFQTINYFICLIMADADGGQELTPVEDDHIFLTQEITYKIIDKANLSTTFPEKNSGSVLLCSLTDKVMTIDLLKKKLSKATLYINTTKSDQTINENKIEYDLSENNQTNKLDIFITNANWDPLVNHINSYQDKAKIEFSLRNPLKETSIHLLTINFINDKQIKICKFLEFPNMEYLENCVEKNKPFYHKSYQEYLFDVLEILPKQITEKTTAISNTTDNIRLHVDMSPIVLLYSTKYTPSFTFFDEFSIKLKHLFLGDVNNDKSLDRFTCKPSICLEVSQLADNRRDQISLHIFKYKYFKEINSYSILEISDSSSYINLGFGKNVIDTQIEEIPLNTSIRALGKGFKLSIIFYTFSQNFSSDVYSKFQNSVNQIEIETYGEKKSLVVLKSNQFSIDYGNHEIQFNIDTSLINQDNQEFEGLENILKDRKGSFGIQVRIDSKIIIEHKVFLNGDMFVLSSNRLREHLSSLEIPLEGTHSGSNTNTDTSNGRKNTEKSVSLDLGDIKSSEKNFIPAGSSSQRHTNEPSLSDHTTGAGNGSSKTIPLFSTPRIIPQHPNRELQNMGTQSNFNPLTSAARHTTKKPQSHQHSRVPIGVAYQNNNIFSSRDATSSDQSDQQKISLNKQEKTNNGHINSNSEISHGKKHSIINVQQRTPLENITSPQSLTIASSGASDSIHIGQKTENEPTFGQETENRKRTDVWTRNRKQTVWTRNRKGTAVWTINQCTKHHG